MAELHDYGGGNDFGGPNPESTEAARLLGASGLLTRIHRSVGFSPRSFDDVDSEHWYLHKQTQGGAVRFYRFARPVGRESQQANLASHDLCGYQCIHCAG